MSGSIPDELLLARQRREREARERGLADLQNQIGELKESLRELQSKFRRQVGETTVDSAALIRTAERVLTGPGFALAERIDLLEATVTEGNNLSQASVEEIRRALATSEYALAEYQLNVTARFNDTLATVNQTLTSYATQSYAEAKKTEAIAAAAADASAQISTALVAYATQAFAEAKKTEAISAAAGDATAKVEAEALVRASKDGYMHGHYLLRTIAGNKVAGMKLTADAGPETWQNTSSIEFQADVFKISTGASEGQATAPFVLNGSTLELNVALVVNGQTLGDIQANASQPPITSIGDFASAPNPASYPVNSVYRNTTDGNTYIRTNISTWALFVEKGATGSTGATGPTGPTGATGTRGSKAFYTSGSSWSDATADSAITAAGLTKVLLDQVTISNGTSFAETRFWDGGSWATISAVINGNLLVNGTVGASKIAVTDLAAINANLGTVTAGSITSNTTVDVGTGEKRVRIDSLGLRVGNVTVDGSANQNTIYISGNFPVSITGGIGSANVTVGGNTSINDQGQLKLSGVTAWYHDGGGVKSAAAVSITGTLDLSQGIKYQHTANRISFGWDGSNVKVYVDGTVQGTIPNP